MKTTSTNLSRTWTETDLTAPEIVAGPGYDIAVHTTRKPGKTEPNDDAALVLQWPDGACVLAVADGVGGAPLGNQASSIAMRCLHEQLGAANPLCDLRPSIMDAIERANAEILDCQTGSATTLTVAEIRNRMVRIYQVGDSTAMVLGGRGAVRYRTISHSPVGYAIESGYLADEDAMNHDDRHYVSNLVGSKEMSIEVGPTIPLAKRDIILLGSDGLFDNLALDEVIPLSLKGTAEERVRALAAKSSQRMHEAGPDEPCKPDDLTIVLWRPHWNVMHSDSRS